MTEIPTFKSYFRTFERFAVDGWNIKEFECVRNIAFWRINSNEMVRNAAFVLALIVGLGLSEIGEAIPQIDEIVEKVFDGFNEVDRGVCSNEFDPVCSTEDITYTNLCIAEEMGKVLLTYSIT